MEENEIQQETQAQQVYEEVIPLLKEVQSENTLWLEFVSDGTPEGTVLLDQDGRVCVNVYDWAIVNGPGGQPVLNLSLVGVPIALGTRPAAVTGKDPNDPTPGARTMVDLHAEALVVADNVADAAKALEKLRDVRKKDVPGSVRLSVDDQPVEGVDLPTIDQYLQDHDGA